MISHKSSPGAKIAAVIALTTCAATAHSQMLEEIVVTVQKRTESVQDVPIAISAMNQEMIVDTGVDNITQILPMLPGVTGSAAGISTNAWAIRGISTNDWSMGSEPSVAVYVDEACIGRNVLATGAFFDLAGLEVIKGPQGTLFGRNAAAGAIALTTNKPADENTLHLGIGAGNEGQRLYDIVANAALSDDFVVRFGYHGTRFDGFWEDVNNNEDAYRDEDAYRLAARWDVTDTFQALLTLNYGDQETNMNGAYSPLLSTVEPGVEYPNKVARTTLDREENETTGANLRLAWELGNNMTLISITDLRDFDYSYQQDVDGSNADATIDAILASLFGEPTITGGLTLEFANPEIKGNTFGQEFRLGGSGERLDWFVGVNYFEEEVDEIQRLNAIDTALGLGTLFYDENITKGDNESLGIFGDVRWSVTEALALTAGGRWTQDEKDWCTQGYADLGFIGVNNGKLCDSEKWTDFSPRLVVDYQFTDDLMVYASASEGYKAGGFNPAAADYNGDFVGDAVASFDPETNTSYELGMKSEFMDGRMRLNAAVYYSDYEDLQVATATIGGILIDNASEAEVTGAEVEWTFMPGANWTLNANYSYIDGEYTDGELDGNVLAYAPENSYAASAKYDMGVGQSTISWFAIYTYQSDFYFDPGNTQEEDGYGLLTARVAFVPASGSWDVALSGENLTDEEYAVARTDIGLGTGPSISQGMPRTYMLTANIYF